MSTESQPISILSETECWASAGSPRRDDSWTSVDAQPGDLPRELRRAASHRLFRTAEGTKLVSAVVNNHVLFEADDHGVSEGWSVIVKGTAHTLRTDEELDEAERAQLLPWIATIKPHYVRIRPLSITGRRFAFGSEPDRDVTGV